MIPHVERDPAFDAYAEALRQREKGMFAYIHERLDEEHPSSLLPLLLSPDTPDEFEFEPRASDRLRLMRWPHWFLVTCIMAGSLVGLIVGLLLS